MSAAQRLTLACYSAKALLGVVHCRDLNHIQGQRVRVPFARGPSWGPFFLNWPVNVWRAFLHADGNINAETCEPHHTG
jgi:hypothetical protein